MTTRFAVISNNCSIPGADAAPLRFYFLEREAVASLQPGEWVEELPLNIGAYRSENTGEWVFPPVTEIYVSVTDLGKLAESDEWECWTSPKQAIADVETLSRGVCLEEEVVIWAAPKGILLQGVSDRFMKKNDRGEEYYLIPPGTKVKLVEVTTPLQSRSTGPYFWDIGGGDTYAHSLSGVIRIEE